MCRVPTAILSFKMFDQYSKCGRNKRNYLGEFTFRASIDRRATGCLIIRYVCYAPKINARPLRLVNIFGLGLFRELVSFFDREHPTKRQCFI